MECSVGKVLFSEKKKFKKKEINVWKYNRLKEVESLKQNCGLIKQHGLKFKSEIPEV